MNTVTEIMLADNNPQNASVANLLKSDFYKTSLKTLTQESIICAFEINHNAFSAPSRGKAQVAYARQIAMYLMHICFGLTFSEVGHLFARDRTTVAHACQRIEDCRDDHRVDLALDALEQALLSFAHHHYREKGEM